MLRNSRKFMFAFLLMPTYMVIFIIYIGMQAGSIEWGRALTFIALNLASAWLLSNKKNIMLNIIGSLFFIGLGWSWFSMIFNPPSNTVFPPPIISWQLEAFVGGVFILIGLCALLYGVIKNRLECGS